MHQLINAARRSNTILIVAAIIDSSILAGVAYLVWWTF